MNYTRNVSESENRLNGTEQYADTSRQRSCQDFSRARNYSVSDELGLKVVPVDTCDLHAFSRKLRTALNGLFGACQVIQRSQLKAEQ